MRKYDKPFSLIDDRYLYTNIFKFYYNSNSISYSNSNLYSILIQTNIWEIDKYPYLNKR